MKDDWPSVVWNEKRYAERLEIIDEARMYAQMLLDCRQNGIKYRKLDGHIMYWKDIRKMLNGTSYAYDYSWDYIYNDETGKLFLDTHKGEFENLLPMCLEDNSTYKHQTHLAFFAAVAVLAERPYDDRLKVFWEYIDDTYAYKGDLNVQLTVNGKTYQCYHYIRPTDKLGIWQRASKYIDWNDLIDKCSSPQDDGGIKTLHSDDDDIKTSFKSDGGIKTLLNYEDEDDDLEDMPSFFKS